MKKVLKAGLILSACGVIAVFVFYLYAYFSAVPLLNENSRIRIYDTNREVFYESNFQKNSQWVNIEEIPQTLIDAVVSIEDRRFYQHFGLDPIRIAKAAFVNVKSNSISEGGSTITQQYARNLFLSLDQTMSRKLEEALLASKIEMHYSKAQILEGYLNTIYYGHGIYGVAKASRFFFNKPLSDCTLGEMAMLAGIPNGPALFSPYISMENAKKRQGIVLNAMADNKKISQEQADQAKSVPVALAEFKKEDLSGSSSYYKDAVVSELKQLGFYDEKYLSRGLEVFTYYDPKVQGIMQNSINAHALDSEQEVAGLILEPFTFNVLAMAGGKDYTISQFNRATNSQRQVGSCLKPLLYYLALEQGFSPSSTFVSEKTNFQISETVSYAPTNFKDLYYNKEISMINAIGVSDNIYAVKTHLFLGTDVLFNALNSFGIQQEEATAAMALGATNFPLIDLAKIYNTFASEGLTENPGFISLVKDSTGKVLYQRDIQPKQLLNRDDTLILNQMMRAPFDIKNMQALSPSLLGYEPFTTVAGKSGSSDWDSLICGFNPQYTVIVWSGYDENKKLESNEERRIPKLIWRDIFNTLYPRGQEGPWYEPSSVLEERRVNPISGQSDSSGSIYWFKKNSQ